MQRWSIQRADVTASLLKVNQLSQSTERGLIPLFASYSYCACCNSSLQACIICEEKTTLVLSSSVCSHSRTGAATCNLLQNHHNPQLSTGVANSAFLWNHSCLSSYAWNLSPVVCDLEQREHSACRKAALGSWTCSWQVLPVVCLDPCTGWAPSPSNSLSTGPSWQVGLKGLGSGYDFCKSFWFCY